MKKKVVVYISDGLLLSHKRNKIWSLAETCVDLVKTRCVDLQSEVPSEREKQILYISTYMWNVEK